MKPRLPGSEESVRARVSGVARAQSSISDSNRARDRDWDRHGDS